MATQVTNEPLYTLIQQRTGLVLNEFRRKEFIHHFNDITPGSLYERLLQFPLSHPLWQDVIRIVTIGETYFFRNEPHFQTLQNHILPMLIASRRAQNQRYLRIWSAGCATGEEPYSIAMLLRSLIPDIDQWSIFLMATDLNKHFLDLAAEGRYSPRAFRNETPEYIKSRWFDKVGEYAYQIKPEIKQMVTFAPLNLISDAYPSLVNNTSGLDLILCRNVTIYFERKETIEVINRFHKALNPGGWLIVGHSEPQPEVYDSFKSHYINRAIFYSKEMDIPVQPRISLAPPNISITTIPVPPKVPSVMDYIKQALEAAGREDWPGAMSLLNEAERADIFNAGVYYLRGLIFQQIGEELKAVASFRQAIYCDPRFALAHYALGELYARREQWGEAKAHWQHAKKGLTYSDPHSPLMCGNDLTGEMLDELLDYRLRERQ